MERLCFLLAPVADLCDKYEDPFSTGLPRRRRGHREGTGFLFFAERAKNKKLLLSASQAQRADWRDGSLNFGFLHHAVADADALIGKVHHLSIMG